MSSTSKTYTVEASSGPVEFPASASPGGKFEGIDGRDIHSFLGIQTRLSSWAPGSAQRLRLKVGKDFIKFTEKRDGLAGRGTTTYLFSQKAAQQLLETSRPKSSLDKQSLAVVPRQSDEDMEKQIKAALPLLETLFGDEASLSVDARKLHAALAVRKDFTDWIKNQLQRGQWVEGRDFAALQTQGENPMGGRPSRANTAGRSSVLLLGRRKTGFGIVLQQLRLELRLGQFIAFVKTVMRKQGVQVGI
jgi:phage anti-repressor protein